MVSASAFQAEDVGSIPITRSWPVVKLMKHTLNIVLWLLLNSVVYELLQMVYTIVYGTILCRFKSYPAN